jgi:hypothetical protein
MTPEKNNLLTELGGDLKSFLEKYEEKLAASPELTIVRTKLQEAKARVEQEFAKYEANPTVAPFKATQTDAQKPQFGPGENNQTEETTPSEQTQPETTPESTQPQDQVSTPSDNMSTDTSQDGETTVNALPAQSEQTPEAHEPGESVMTIE